MLFHFSVWQLLPLLLQLLVRKNLPIFCTIGYPKCCTRHDCCNLFACIACCKPLWCKCTKLCACHEDMDPRSSKPCPCHQAATPRWNLNFQHFTWNSFTVVWAHFQKGAFVARLQRMPWRESQKFSEHVGLLKLENAALYEKVFWWTSTGKNQLRWNLLVPAQLTGTPTS